MASSSKYSRGPGDSILALLEPGEYVLNRNAVDEIGKENLDELNYEDYPRFDMSQRGQVMMAQTGGMLGDMIGYQKGGDKGLEYAEEYEYSPTSIQKLLDKLPGLGGKRAYDRARQYVKDVHYQPETKTSRSSDVSSAASKLLREEDDITTKNIWHQRMLVQDRDDPRKFGYKNMLERDDITDINQYIIGSPSGHIMETDDIEDYAVDPYNIVKSEAGRSLFGLPLGGYSGSVKENPGIDPYIDPKSLMGQVTGMQAGGSTLEYGGATTETQSLEDIYRQNNMVPNRQQRPGFEEKWAYDPSREGVIFEDYGRTITGATQKGRQNLIGAGQKTTLTEAKQGFAGAGGPAQTETQQRGNIMQDFLAQEGAAKSTLFKDVRAERERWATDVTGALGTLEGQGGTSPYDTNVTETAGGEQYQSQEAWYQLGFPDETSWQNWVTAGSNPEEMGQYGQDPQSAASNLATTTGLSDVRLKKDINYIFTMENGVPIYTFKYKWSDDVNIGTMAQDIEDMIPEAVSTNSAGYKMVNYSKVFNYGKI